MTGNNAGRRELRFIASDTRGASTVEYALITTVASLAILTGGMDLASTLMRGLQAFPFTAKVVVSRGDDDL